MCDFRQACSTLWGFQESSLWSLVEFNATIYLGISRETQFGFYRNDNFLLHRFAFVCLKQSCYVCHQVYLKFIILLLQSPKYWDFRYVLPCHALLTSQGCLFICHF